MGEPDLSVGDRHVGAVAHVVLEPPKWRDPRLIGVGDVRVNGRVGIASQGKAVVGSAKHVEELLLADGPISGHAQREDARPDKWDVATGIEADGAEGPAGAGRGQPWASFSTVAVPTPSMKYSPRNACPKSVVDVQPRTARVVVNPSDLKPELFACAVVRGQGEQVSALNHISVKTGGKPPNANFEPRQKPILHSRLSKWVAVSTRRPVVGSMRALDCLWKESSLST